MGFQPSKSHPVEVSLAGTKVSMSIASAETLMATIRALIAEARLVEAREYLDYRITQHGDDMATLRLRLDKAEAVAKRRPRKSR